MARRRSYREERCFSDLGSISIKQILKMTVHNVVHRSYVNGSFGFAAAAAAKKSRPAYTLTKQRRTRFESGLFPALAGFVTVEHTTWLPVIRYPAFVMPDGVVWSE